jgi:hypothetical protein
MLLLTQYIFSDESSGDVSSQEHFEDEYYDYETTEGITIYGEREKIEDKIIEILNKEQETRKEFIEEELLIKSGFRRSANVKFRKTTDKEKALSVLHGLFAIATAGAVPVKPFTEVEYDRLPDGEFYNFYTILFNSDLKNISLEVQRIMELEYKLQIEFANGTLIENWNVKYYTEENIGKFERLILSLPDTMDDIRPIKERFLNIELPKVKTALYRYLNPSELYIQARKNLSDMFKHND